MTNERIKAIIVDDEYLTRKLMKNCIDWSSLNMEIVGEAGDADEALSLIDQFVPDVIFTDVQMPIIDGIQLSEMALKKHPGIKIVVLTGFNNFDYAQRSIKIGIADYLLKPINHEEVLKSALKIKLMIEQERKNNKEYIAMRKQLYDNLPYLRERFFNELLVGGVKDTAADERMSFLGISFRYSSFQIALIELSMKGKIPEESRLIFNMKILNYVEAALKDDGDVFVFFDTMNRIVILNNDENSDLYETCERLLEGIVSQNACILSIGLGRLKRGISEVCDSYREALEAINYRVAVGNNSVILYDNINFSTQKSVDNVKELYVQLEFYIKTGLKDKVLETIEKIFNNIDLKDDAAVKTIRIDTMNIISACFRQLVDMGLDPEEVYRLETQSYHQIFSLDTLPDIRDYLEGILEKTIEKLNVHQNRKISNFIDDIKSYVKEHYADSGLTLAGIAKMFFLNPSYLSRTFKKETGISFVEYLTSIRMEKAIELLKGDLKVFAIAEAVGISDSNYFSTCFKRYTGLSTIDFRKSLSSNSN